MAIRCALFAVFAGRIVAAIDRGLEELVLIELPELADSRIGLDDRVPELRLVVAEHLLALDLLDIDVLYRVTHVVEADRTTDGVELHRREQLDELDRCRGIAAVFPD